MSDMPQGGEKKGWWKRQTLTSKILLGFFVIIVLLIIAGAAFVMTLPHFTAINITSQGPLNNERTILQINGTTDPGATVIVNNQTANVDSDGKFTYDLSGIVTGNNTVNITAKAPNKKSSTIIMVVTRTVTETDTSTFYHLESHWKTMKHSILDA
jgi:hypothetical protein